MRPRQAPRSGAQEPHWWSVRAVASVDATVLYARHHTFCVGSPAGFNPLDHHPSSVELLLAAVGGELTASFSRLAKQRGLQIDDLEIRVSGRLQNPLVAIGVIGEDGHPGLEEVRVTAYASSDSPEPVLQAAWCDAVATCPVTQTLRAAVAVFMELQLIP